MDVVVDISVDQHEVPLQAGRDFRVGLDAVDEGRVALRNLLLDTVVLL